VPEGFGAIEQLIEIGRYAEARRLVERVLRETPADPDAHFYAARIARALDDELNARAHVEQALAADPTHFGARVVLYQVLCDAREHAEAEAVIQALIREDPEEPELFALYARLMLKTLHVDKAGRLADEALRLDPSNALARMQSVLVSIVRGERARTEDQLAELIKDDPEGTAAAATLFVALVEQRRHREALALGQQLLRAHPDNAHFVDALVELRAVTHWLMWPAYPLVRWGWGGSAFLWAGALVLFGVLRASGAGPIAGTLALAYIAYCVYTWVAPSLVRRWVAARGIS
jgi:tetratricopeptide (TPR) repeat protein